MIYSLYTGDVVCLLCDSFECMQVRSGSRQPWDPFSYAADVLEADADPDTALSKLVVQQVEFLWANEGHAAGIASLLHRYLSKLAVLNNGLNELCWEQMSDCQCRPLGYPHSSKLPPCECYWLVRAG